MVNWNVPSVFHCFQHKHNQYSRFSALRLTFDAVFFRSALIQSIIIHKLVQNKKTRCREIWLLQSVLLAPQAHHSHVIIAPMKIRNYRFIEQINFLHGEKYGSCLQSVRASHANNENFRTRKKLSKMLALFNDCLFDHWIHFRFSFSSFSFFWFLFFFFSCIFWFHNILFAFFGALSQPNLCYKRQLYRMVIRMCSVSIVGALENNNWGEKENVLNFVFTLPLKWVTVWCSPTMNQCVESERNCVSSSCLQYDAIGAASATLIINIIIVSTVVINNIPIFRRSKCVWFFDLKDVDKVRAWVGRPISD